MLFSEINENLLEEYKNFLVANISRRTSHHYFLVFRNVLKKALADKLLITNPAANVKSVSFKESEIVYLALEELKKLKATACKNEVLKRAFIWSALTGIRHIDLL